MSRENPMSEIKPVASICVSHWRGIAGMENIELQMRVDLPDGVHPVYVIPDTHRIVSVDTLEHLFSSVYYAEDEALIRAIIDKEEST
jgi:hypothetical protein